MCALRLERLAKPIFTIMIVNPINSTGIADKLQELVAYDLQPRSQGTLHLSQIYSSLERIALGREISDFTPEELKFFAAGGFLWERVFSMAMAESFRTGDIVRPGEFMVDGIIGSPDNWNLVTGKVIETKCTWRSATKLEHFEKFFWTWLVQMQGYCRLLGTRQAELYVFCVNGNYRPPTPIIMAYELEWTSDEIDGNWDMLKRHAKKQGWL